MLLCQTLLCPYNRLFPLILFPMGKLILTLNTSSLSWDDFFFLCGSTVLLFSMEKWLPTLLHQKVEVLFFFPPHKATRCRPYLDTNVHPSATWSLFCSCTQSCRWCSYRSDRSRRFEARTHRCLPTKADGKHLSIYSTTLVSRIYLDALFPHLWDIADYILIEWGCLYTGNVFATAKATFFDLLGCDVTLWVNYCVVLYY